MKPITKLFVALMVFSVSATVSAKADSADLEQLAKAVVEALNSNDTELRESFLKEYYLNADSAAAIERWQSNLQMFAGDLGALVIHNIDVSNPEVLTMLVQSTNPGEIGEWHNLDIYMHKEQTSKMFSLGIRQGNPPILDLPDRPLTTAEIAKRVGEFVDNLVERDEFSGTVSLVKDRKQFFTGAYGKADLRWGIDNKLDTKFNLGSMNKMFTGVAICQLVSDGKLAFDDPIIKHLPDFPNQEVAKKVTVHHLLTHTSGMGSYWEAMSKVDWTGLRSVRDFAELAMGDALEFEPDERFGYSNTGPLILGLIIEALSGMDYHDYIRKHVTGPAGMTNTDCYHVDDIIPNLAQGYYHDQEAGNLRSNIYKHSARGSAAGGGFSTVEDLQRFATALLNGTLLTKEMLATYTTGKVDLGPDVQYAYLIEDSHKDGLHSIGHDGGAPGISAQMKIFPEIGFTIAAMGNYDSGTFQIISYVTQLIAHKRVS
ncbi:beta-lactamase family protein [bacterium AH-315-J21]|nr:beta-lactamase family protein [bacterium AH-315-J21]